jgi:hypothetical protein
LRGPRAGPPAHELLDVRGRRRILRAGGGDEFDGKPDDFIRDRHGANQLLDLDDGFGIEHGRQLREFGAGRISHHEILLGVGGVLFFTGGHPAEPGATAGLVIAPGDGPGSAGMLLKGEF